MRGSFTKKTITTLLLATTAGTACLAFNAPAMAQGAEAAQKVDEIIVTARRREEVLQQVPVAVQAFTQDQLEQRRIDEPLDLQKIVPSLTASGSDRAGVQYTLRGQSGSGASFSGQQVAVTSYFADIPLPIGDAFGPGRFFDLQNIQVLKGPQGTLFGRNATGGAVLLVPQRPTEDLGGYVQFKYGSYNDRDLEAALNVPFSDKVLFRISGKAEGRDGYTDNPTTGQKLDDRRYISGRASLVLKASDTLENYAVFDIFHNGSNGSSNHLTNVDSLSPVAGLYAGQIEAALARQQAAGPRTTFSGAFSRNRIDTIGLSNTTTWNATPEITFKNIFGYRSVESLKSFDFDGSAITLLDFDTCSTSARCNTESKDNPQFIAVRQITEEPQIQGTLFDGKLNYTLGAFFLDVKSPDSNYQHQTSVLGSQSDTNILFHDKSVAGYGQMTYDLAQWVDGLKFTAGYRYTDDKRRTTVSQVSSGRCATGTPGLAAPDASNAPQCKANFNVDQGTSSYTFGLDYEISKDAMVFFNHRRGYRTGGVNPFMGPLALATPPLPFAAQLFTYKPEIVLDYEVGAKADWRFNDMSLRTNLTFYHTDQDDAQITQTIPVGTLNPFGLTNASSADVNGVEFETVFSPTPAWELRGAYAYTDASFGTVLDYVNRDASNNPTTSTGRRFPFTPKHKLDVSLRYLLPLDESMGKLSTTVSWSHKSTVLLGLVPFTRAGTLDTFAFQKPTNSFDVTVNWNNIGQSGFDAAFFVTNFTDTTYNTGGASLINSLGIDQAVYNDPRMFGLQLRYSF